MADDDEKAHDWDPDREKRQTDPEALARSFVRAAAEEQKKIEEEARKERVAKDMGRPAVIGTAYTHPMDLQFAVHKITNGYLVLYSQAPAGFQGGRNFSQEIYAENPTAVVAATLRIVQEYLDGKLADPGRSPFLGPVVGGYDTTEPA